MKEIQEHLLSLIGEKEGKEEMERLMAEEWHAQADYESLTG
jgi:hypothetical protein